MNKFKFPWKNEEEQASISSILKSELDSKNISIWFQFSNEFGTRPCIRLQLPEAWTQCSFIVVFAQLGSKASLRMAGRDAGECTFRDQLGYRRHRRTSPFSPFQVYFVHVRFFFSFWFLVLESCGHRRAFCRPFTIHVFLPWNPRIHANIDLGFCRMPC